MTATAEPRGGQVSTGVLDAHVRRHGVDAVLQVPLLEGGVTVLFGPSGSGKTTVLRCLAGLDRVDAGHVVFDGTTWDDGARQFVRPRHRRVGYLFQDHALFPHLSVADNVAYGLPRAVRRERDQRVREALEVTEATGCLPRTVRQLSGGEAQRVALARALAPRPRLLLLDEPLSALDTPTRLRLREQLRRLLRRSGTPSVIVTHDRAEALALADRVVVLLDGAVRQTGDPVEVFDRPADPGVAAVVGMETATPGRVVSVADDLVTVAVGSAQVVALDVAEASPAPGDDVLVCVRAEDVALEAPAAGAPVHSARNRLPAQVQQLGSDGPLVRVDLDAGFPLTAYITRPAREELALAPGSRVMATVKSPAVHLISR
jgi:molybdate transport system ATP-binding protein